MLTEKEFVLLLRRYGEGNTPQEREIMNRFYERLSFDLSLTDLTEKEIEIRGQELWRTLRRNAQKETMPISISNAFSRTVSGIAASLLILMTYLFLTAKTASVENQSWQDAQAVVLENRHSSEKEFFLADKSSVILQAGSKLIIRPFGVTRTVSLDGEAFFKVTRDAAHPFIVEAQGLRTTVLGTSFTVKAHAFDSAIVVKVKTGKVSVSKVESGKSKEYFITPNHEIVYYKKADRLQVQIQKNPQVVIAPAELLKMNFDEAPVKEVFEALEKAYNVDLVYDAAAFENCTVTTRLSDEGFYDRLTIIGRLLNAEYETIETKVYIKGGCRQNLHKIK